MFIIGAILIVGAVLILLDSIRKSIKFTQKSDYAIALNRILKKINKIEAIRLDEIDTTKNQLLYEAKLSINNNEVEGDN